MDGMKGKVCIVTGSNSGIGFETALALAGMDARVIMVVRDLGRGEAARKEIVAQTRNGSVDLMQCDLSSVDSIRRFTTECKQRYDQVNVLINNAGAVFARREVTQDGFERTLAVDYLGPFLLTHELLGLLKRSAPSRIINVSSGLATRGRIDLNDLQSEKSYSGMRVYSNVKRMLTLYTYELADRLRFSGVTVNAVMPGFVATNLGRNSGSLGTSIMFALTRPIQISARKGAATSIYTASSDEVRDTTGKCFAKQKETSSCPMPDKALQAELWEKTIELLGLPND